MDIFCFGGRGGGHYEIGLFFKIILFYFIFCGGGGLSFLYIIGRFKVKIQNGNIFGGPQIFKYFWVYLIFLIFLGFFLSLFIFFIYLFFFFFLGGGCKQ